MKVSHTEVGSKPPTNAIDGYFWLNTNNYELYIYDGVVGSWVQVSGKTQELGPESVGLLNLKNNILDPTGGLEFNTEGIRISRINPRSVTLIIDSLAGADYENGISHEGKSLNEIVDSYEVLNKFKSIQDAMLWLRDKADALIKEINIVFDSNIIESYDLNLFKFEPNGYGYDFHNCSKVNYASNVQVNYFSSGYWSYVNKQTDYIGQMTKLEISSSPLNISSYKTPLFIDRNSSFYGLHFMFNVSSGSSAPSSFIKVKSCQATFCHCKISFESSSGLSQSSDSIFCCEDHGLLKITSNNFGANERLKYNYDPDNCKVKNLGYCVNINTGISLDLIDPQNLGKIGHAIEIELNDNMRFNYIFEAKKYGAIEIVEERPNLSNKLGSESSGFHFAGTANIRFSNFVYLEEHSRFKSNTKFSKNSGANDTLAALSAFMSSKIYGSVFVDNYLTSDLNINSLDNLQTFVSPGLPGTMSSDVIDYGDFGNLSYNGPEWQTVAGLENDEDYLI